MNANELADELDGFLKEQEQLPWGTKQVYLDQAATMLRQQAEQINNLQQWQKRHLDLIDTLKYEKSSGVYDDEPVAWMRKEDKDTFFSAIDHSLNSKWIPLYTHSDQIGLAESIIKQQELEIKRLKEALRMKVILNEHAQQSMKEMKELLRNERN